MKFITNIFEYQYMMNLQAIMVINLQLYIGRRDSGGHPIVSKRWGHQVNVMCSYVHVHISKIQWAMMLSTDAYFQLTSLSVNLRGIFSGRSLGENRRTTCDKK